MTREITDDTHICYNAYACYYWFSL